MWGKRSGNSLLSVAHLISMPVSRENERAGKLIFAHEPSNLLEAGGRGWYFGGSPPSATAKLVWIPAVREDERAGHFFIVRCRRIVFTLWVGGKRAGVFLFSAKTHLVCIPVGKEGKCVALLFDIFGHLSFSGQGTEVGFCFGSLPRVAARLVGTPLVGEGKRAWRVYFVLPTFYFHRLGPGGRRCQRLPTLWGDNFHMHGSKSEGRARVTILFAPSAVKISRRQGRGWGF